MQQLMDDEKTAAMKTQFEALLASLSDEEKKRLLNGH
jgi:hypothetical protein